MERAEIQNSNRSRLGSGGNCPNLKIPKSGTKIFQVNQTFVISVIQTNISMQANKTASRNLYYVRIQ